MTNPPDRILRSLTNRTTFRFTLTVSNSPTVVIEPGTTQELAVVIPDASDSPKFKGASLSLAAAPATADGQDGPSFIFCLARSVAHRNWVFGGFEKGPGAKDGFPRNCRVLDPFPIPPPVAGGPDYWPEFHLVLTGADSTGDDFRATIRQTPFPSKFRPGEDGGGGEGDGGDGGGGGGDGGADGGPGDC